MTTTEEKPIRISMDDFVLTGGGANGESYDHKTDPNLMLKLYLPGKIEQPLYELQMARKVYEMGIPTPKPGDYVVTEDGRYEDVVTLYRKGERVGAVLVVRHVDAVEG